MDGSTTVPAIGRAVAGNWNMDNRRAATLAHWNLDRWPFANVAAADQFYPTAGRDEALARIEYLVEARRRLGVLVGPAGAGKSTLLAAAARRVRRSGCAVAQVGALGITPRELFLQIAAGLQTTPSSEDDVPRLWRLIADRVAENRLQETSTIVIVDDAGEAGADTISQLTRLTRIDPSPAARWTVVVVAEPAQAARWNVSLRETVDLRIEVEPWEAEDSIGFVQTALVDAGSARPLFTDRALQALHEMSGGLPRTVCRLAEFALLAGAASGADEVDEDLVRVAGEEVTWQEPAMSVG
jgi:general secretion pathway protein A